MAGRLRAFLAGQPGKQRIAGLGLQPFRFAVATAEEEQAQAQPLHADELAQRAYRFEGFRGQRGVAVPFPRCRRGRQGAP